MSDATNYALREIADMFGLALVMDMGVRPQSMSYVTPSELVERLRARLATPASAPVGETREQLLDALKPFAEFARQWNRQPLSRIADEVYGIHGGTEYEAYLRLSDCRRALEVYDAARAAERRDQEEGR